jgi:hypothetical protein
MQVALIVLAVIFTLIVVAGLFIPRTQTFSCTAAIQADHRRVYALLEDLEAWQQWSAWSILNDASLRIVMGDKSHGKQAGFTWEGPKMGKGQLDITEAYPYTRLVVHTQFKNRRFRVQHDIHLRGEKNNCQINWTATVKTGWSSPSRILGKLVMQRLQQDTQTGFILLKQLAESGL